MDIKKKELSISYYNNSFLKRLLDLTFSIILLIVFLPAFLTTCILLRIFSGSKIFFIQERSGRKNKVFKIIKFRTMKKGAEYELKKYYHLNEADGPVFKIRNDPRFTKFGKFLSTTGLDELPQLINVLKGDMSLVGPRPLPIYEYKKLNKVQRMRNSIKPGITSTWVIYGSHSLSFKKWMSLDIDYIKKASLFTDIKVIIKTSFIPFKRIFSFICNR